MNQERAAPPLFDPVEDRRRARREGWIILGIVGGFCVLLAVGLLLAPMLSLWIVAGAFYLTPAALAGMNSHRNAWAICVLNLFLGWTVIGWIVALVWACTKDRRANV